MGIVKKLYNRANFAGLLFAIMYTVYGKYNPDEKERLLLKYLKKKYGKTVKEFSKDMNEEREILYLYNKVIWVFWWQGEANMPLIVRKCYENIVRNSNGHEVILITECNYQSYVSLPQYIIDKMINGKINIAHFSDIVRITLLSNYGGLWLDTTIWLHKKIPEEIFERNFYSQKYNPTTKVKYLNISAGLWSTFILESSKPNNFLFLLLKECLYKYWMNNDFLIDYFLTDHMFRMCYDLSDNVKEIVDALPPNNENVFILYELMNKPFNAGDYDLLCRSSDYFKVTYKGTYIDIVDGKETYYNALFVNNWSRI